jgi:Zn-dependent peptidase ImmA (M78 family)
MQFSRLQLVRSSFQDAIARRASSLDAKDIEPLIRKVAFVVDVLHHSMTRVNRRLPTTTLPIQVSDASKLALKLRYNSGTDDVEPFFQLPAILEQFGVCLMTFEQPPIFGGCTIVDGVPVILVSARADIDSLYACARELGLLLTLPPRREKGVAAIIDTARNDNHYLRGLYERFADYFALELLIPSHGLGIALQEVRKLLKVSNPALGDVEILYLSRIFGVSFQAMARRCERAQLLPRGGAAALLQFLMDKCGGPERRASDLNLPPRPLLRLAPLSYAVLFAIGNLVRSGEISLEQLSTELDYSTELLARMLQQGLN